MYRLLFAFVLALGFMVVGFNTSASAAYYCQDECDGWQDCRSEEALYV